MGGQRCRLGVFVCWCVLGWIMCSMPAIQGHTAAYSRLTSGRAAAAWTMVLCAGLTQAGLRAEDRS